MSFIFYFSIFFIYILFFKNDLIGGKYKKKKEKEGKSNLLHAKQAQNVTFYIS